MLKKLLPLFLCLMLLPLYGLAAPFYGGYYNINSYIYGGHKNTPVNYGSEKAVFYNVHDGCVDVYAKYGSGSDIMVRFARSGPNMTYDFYQIYFIDRQGNARSTSEADGVLFYGGVTDWHSPFLITADANATGDRAALLDFTGGYHGYNNDNTGSKTAEHKSISCTADGKAVSTGAGYCEKFEITWVNGVQASNTKLSDGTGREVMLEEHKMTFDGKIWTSHVTLSSLENITIHKLYGFQAEIKNKWDDKYFCKYNHLFPPISEYGETMETRANEIICIRGTNILRMTLNPAVGIGNRLYCRNAPQAFISEGSKVYFNIVSGYPLPVRKGESVSYEGTYQFISAI